MSAVTPKATFPSQLPTVLLLRRARRAFRGAVAALTVASAAVVAVGCTTAAQPPAAANAAERRGLAGAVGVALDEVELDAGQRTAAQGVLDDLQAGTEPVRAARQRAAGQIADRIAAGTLAQADVDAALAELAKAEATAVPAFQDAANKLHGLLDAGQREDLLDAVRSSFRDRWHGEDGPKARLRQLADDLELTDDQRDAIKAKAKEEFKRAMPAAREKMEGMRDRMEEAADAFVSEQFDAKALGLGEDGMGMRRAFVATQLRIAQAALPTLTPAQRAKLAEFVRAHAAAME